MKKSKFFRVAVAGSTTDGRVIEPTWLDQIAESYNQNTYTALGNLEHIKSLHPDSTFGSYAKVMSAEVRDVDINGTTKKALYVQVEAFDSLIELHKKGQKLFTSIEINPNFADTGKAYLIGIAFTDNPASLGTEIMEFASQKPESNPFSAKKQDKNNLFTASKETEIEFEEPSLFSQVMDWLKPEQEKNQNNNNDQFSQISKSVLATAEAHAKLKEDHDKVLSDLNEYKTNFDSLSEKFNQLESDLNKTPESTTPPPSTGHSNYSKIEC